MHWREARSRINRPSKTLEIQAPDRHCTAMATPSENTSERFTLAPGMPFDPSQFDRMVSLQSHSGFIGMTYRKHGSNWLEMAIPWREDLVGDVETGVMATGPIISLLDNTTSMSVWAKRGTFQPQVTLDLRVDYLRAATPGKDLIAWAECYQIKRSMAFVRGIAHDGDINDPVANVAGIFIQVEPETSARAQEASK